MSAEAGPLLGPSAGASSSADDPRERARRTVIAWSDALDKHDVGALASFYGDPVQFYGSQLSRSSVVQAKQQALRRESTFHQSILGDVEVATGEDGSVTATFLKRSGPSARMRDVRAKLVLRMSGDAPLVVEETDEVAANRPRREKSAAEGLPDDCESTAARVVMALPEVKRTVAMLTKAAGETDGRARFGGIGPNPDEDGGFLASMGIHTDERYESYVVYSVDGAGHLSVIVWAEDVPVPRADLLAVERACAPSSKLQRR